MSAAAWMLHYSRIYAANAAWRGEYLSYMDSMRAIGARIIAGDYL